jgi:hypothetical protein
MGLVSPEFVDAQVKSLQNRTAWQHQYSALASPDVIPRRVPSDDGNSVSGATAGGASGSASKPAAVTGLSLAEQHDLRRELSSLDIGGQDGEHVGEMDSFSFPPIIYHRKTRLVRQKCLFETFSKEYFHFLTLS